MKIQLEILLLCLKKTFKWYLMMLFMVVIYVISIQIVRNIETNDLMILFGIVDLKSLNFLGTLVMIYQYSFTIYFSYLFYNYEADNYIYNILMRSKAKRWFKSKVIVQFLSIIIFQIIYYVLILSFASFNISKYIFMILIAIFSHLFISIIVSFLSNHLRKKINVLFWTIVLLFFEIMLINYTFFPIFILFFILILYDNYNFSLKKNYVFF